MADTTALGYTPAFAISKGGEDITASFADRLVSLRVESREGGGDADTCTISLDDRDWRIALPSIGEDSTTLSVAMGYVQSAIYPMGTFQVDEISLVSPPKGMTLQGNSVSFNTALKSPIITSHDMMSLGDIIGGIAQSAGVTAAVDPELSGIQIPYLNQSQSSGHLLSTLESRFNALAKFADGMLSFTKRGTGLNVSGQSIGTFTLTSEDLGTYEIKLSNRNSFSQVKAGWWDNVNNQTQWVKSTVAGSPASSVPFTLRRIQPSQAEAQAAADSQMALLNRKAKTGTITLAKGDPSIRGGQSLTVTGTRDGVDGTYVVSRAIHNLAKSGGLTTTLDVYDDGGDGSDLSGESTDGQIDTTGIPATVLPTNGIGHM